MLSSSTYSLVKIPIDPIVHTFRPGTELRVVISAPGGDRPIWEFDTLDNGQRATVGHRWPDRVGPDRQRGVRGAGHPALPACNSLRGEPCRPYQAEGNQ